MTLLEKIDFLMQKKGLNKRTLAIQSEIPYTTVHSFYARGTDNIRIATIEKMGRFFDVSLDYLIRDEITDPNYGKADPNETTFELLFRSLTEDEKQQTIRFMRGLVSTRSQGEIPLRENAG